MLSAMSPTIVLDSAGAVLLVVGGRGGPRIVTSTAQVILNVIDRHMSLEDSSPLPYHQAIPDSLRYDREGLVAAVRDSLASMGYTLAAGVHRPPARGDARARWFQPARWARGLVAEPQAIRDLRLLS